jgi:hexokinase
LPSILVGGFDSSLPSSSRGVSGGTNLRVCLVTLQGKGKFEITQSKYRLTEEQKQEEGQKLFDFCAECLKTFIETNLGEGTVKEGEKLPLGFTVSP